MLSMSMSIRTNPCYIIMQSLLCAQTIKVEVFAFVVWMEGAFHNLANSVGGVP